MNPLLLRRIVKISVLTLAFLFIAFVGWMYSSPSEIKLKDFIYIDAVAAHSKEFVSDFKNWETWNKIPQQDEGVIVKMTERTKGKDASYAWSSPMIGEGVIRNVRETEDKLFQSYTFQRPFGQSECEVTWDFEEVRGRTKLTWTIDGEIPFFLRWITQSIISQLKKETRIKLHQLKDQIELRDIQNLGIKISVSKRSPNVKFIYTKGRSSLMYIPKELAKLFDDVATYGLKKRISFRGKPFTIYSSWQTDPRLDMEIRACIPVRRKVSIPANSPFKYGEISSGKSLKVVFKGPYDKLTKVHGILNSYIRQNNIEVKGDPVEFYSVNLSPNDTRFFVTEIYVPIY